MQWQKIRDWLTAKKFWARLQADQSAPTPIIRDWRDATPLNAKSGATGEQRGTFFHLEDILRQIPKCHSALRALKKWHPDAYDYHARVGARMVSHRAVVAIDRIGADFLRDLPSAGMVFLPGDERPNGDDRSPMFVYFEKRHRAAYVRPPTLSEATIYNCSIAFVPDDDTAIVSQFHVAVDGDGELELLRERQVGAVTVNEKSKRRGGGRVTSHGGSKSSQSSSQHLGASRHSGPRFIAGKGHMSIPRIFWGYPSQLVRLHACMLAERGDDEAVHSIEETAFTAFAAAAHFWRGSLGEYQVRAKRRGVTAAFGVDVGRTPYFFKDRQTEAAADGKRKRIFHSVEAHNRHMADGRVIPVKAHYRGERRFSWGGNDVLITVPGLHHNPIHKFRASSFELEEGAKASGSLTSQQAGRMIERHLEGAA